MAESAPSQGENRRAIRNVVLLTFVGLACLWGFFAYWAVNHRQESIAATESSLSQMNHAVEQYARNVIKMAEVFQATAEHWLVENEPGDPRADPGFVALIEDFRKRTGGLIDIRMMTATGDLYYFPGNPARPVDNVADREYFRAAMQLPPGARHFGVPVISRVTGEWRMPITTRMRKPHRGLEVINASINLTEMIGTFESERTKPNGAISLWRADGTLLARAPHVESAIARPVAAASEAWKMVTARPAGSFLSAGTPVDGRERFVSHKRLDDYPLYILVSSTLDDTLAPWRRQVLMVAIALAFVTIWGLLYSGRLVDALRKVARNTVELERLATVDALTGLYNRRYLMETGVHETARMRRYHSPMALMLLDIDHFKDINDTWGHPVGDRVLQGLAHVINAIVRDQDTVGRLGGEEFAVILPETDPPGAMAIAERLRAAVQDAQMARADDGRSVRITASIGVTAVIPEIDSFDAALGRADKALYQAKRSGRNRVAAG